MSEQRLCNACGKPAEEFGPYILEDHICRSCAGVANEEVGKGLDTILLYYSAAELLAAAKEVMFFMPLWHPMLQASDSPQCPGCQAIRKLEAAIAKAEGKES